MITIFPSFPETKSPSYYRIESVVKSIASSEAIEKKITALRSEQDEKKQDALKKLLPCILFSGSFTQRDEAFMTSHSGLAVVDFDTKDSKGYFVKDPEAWMEKHPGTMLIEPVLPAGVKRKNGHYALIVTDPALFRDSLKQYPFIVMAFISPRANGVKAVVKIPPSIPEHRGRYEALIQFFEVMDTTNKNPSRICFASYDPEVWFRSPETCDTFEGYVVPNEAPPAAVRAHATDYSKISISVKMIRSAVHGEKHDKINRACYLAGGYAAAGFIEDEEALRILEHEIRSKPNLNDVSAHLKTMREAFDDGKLDPVREQNTGEKLLPKTQSTNGIIRLSGVRERMRYQFVHGKERGKTTHFPILDEHFTWKKTDLTLWSGIPNSGKSAFITFLMLLRSVFDGEKWAIFSPESYPADEFYDMLIEMLVGKSTDPYYSDNQMSMAHYEEAMDFIEQHFYFVYPDVSHTIAEIESEFTYAIRELGVTGCMIDPHNQLTHLLNGLRDDQYLDTYLTSRKRFAIDNNVYYVIVCHPKPVQRNSEGEYEAVDIYNLAGGAMWANKVDNFGVTRRPHQSKSPKDQAVEIIIRKIKKQKLVGVPGTVNMEYSRKTARYYDSTGMTPLSIIRSGAEQESPKIITDLAQIRPEIVTEPKIITGFDHAVSRADTMNAWGAQLLSPDDPSASFGF